MSERKAMLEHHAAKPCVVHGYYVYPNAKGVFISGRNYGLGNAASAVVATV